MLFKKYIYFFISVSSYILGMMHNIAKLLCTVYSTSSDPLKNRALFVVVPSRHLKSHPLHFDKSHSQNSSWWSRDFYARAAVSMARDSTRFDRLSNIVLLEFFIIILVFRNNSIYSACSMSPHCGSTGRAKFLKVLLMCICEQSYIWLYSSVWPQKAGVSCLFWK